MTCPGPCSWDVRKPGLEPRPACPPLACAPDRLSALCWLRPQPQLPGPGPDLTIAHHGGKGPHQLQQYGCPHSGLGRPWAPRIPLGPDDNVMICGRGGS